MQDIIQGLIIFSLIISGLAFTTGLLIVAWNLCLYQEKNVYKVGKYTIIFSMFLFTISLVSLIIWWQTGNFINYNMS